MKEKFVGFLGTNESRTSIAVRVWNSSGSLLDCCNLLGHDRLFPCSFVRNFDHGPIPDSDLFRTYESSGHCFTFASLWVSKD